MKKHKNTTGIPDCEFDSLARILLPAIQKLFEDDQIKNDFKQWQEKQKSENKKSISLLCEMLFLLYRYGYLKYTIKAIPSPNGKKFVFNTFGDPPETLASFSCRQ